MVYYVDRAGRAGHLPPCPRSIMGANGSLIAGMTLPWFVPLEVEPWLCKLIWESGNTRYSQEQLTC